MQIERRRSKTVKIGKISIGGNNPIAIQSMLKSRTADIEEAVRQVKELEACGCQIVRLAIKDLGDALALKRIKKHVSLPLVADIHFDWRLAIAAIENGADKIRLNPGNIYKDNQLKEIIAALKSAGLPLRIGLNSGSLRDAGAARKAVHERLTHACLAYVRRVEKLKFENIVISLKASNVLDTLAAYRRISKLCAYPLHLGLTATGAAYQGLIKSSIALGALLSDGIGDTIRVSLTDRPQEEVRAAKGILESLGLGNFQPQLISCPTCGRCEVDLVKIVRELERRLSAVNLPAAQRKLKIAVMGCVVNGPGEAKEADIGVAFGKGSGILFKKGRALKRISFDECVEELLKGLERAR